MVKFVQNKKSPPTPQAVAAAVAITSYQLTGYHHNYASIKHARVLSSSFRLLLAVKQHEVVKPSTYSI